MTQIVLRFQNVFSLLRGVLAPKEILFPLFGCWGNWSIRKKPICRQTWEEHVNCTERPQFGLGIEPWTLRLWGQNHKLQSVTLFSFNTSTHCCLCVLNNIFLSSQPAKNYVATVHFYWVTMVTSFCETSLKSFSHNLICLWNYYAKRMKAIAHKPQLLTIS